MSIWLLILTSIAIVFIISYFVELLFSKSYNKMRQDYEQKRKDQEDQKKTNRKTILETIGRNFKNRSNGKESKR